MGLNRFYYDGLTLKERECYRILLDGVHARREVITFPGWQEGMSTKALIHAVSFDHPEIYQVDLSSWKELWNRRRMGVYMTYADDPVTAMCKDRRIRDALQVFLKGLDCLAPYERELLIHDRLIDKVIYGVNPAVPHHAYTVEGVLLDGKAVCQGISKAFAWLCRLSGIETCVVSGKVTQDGSGAGTGSHSWNMVKILDHCYHVDVTWDCGFENGPSRRYFNVPDEIVFHTRQFSGEYGFPLCRNLLTHLPVVSDSAEFVAAFKKESRRKGSKVEIRIDPRNGLTVKDAVFLLKQVGHSTSYRYCVDENTSIVMLYF